MNSPCENNLLIVDLEATFWKNRIAPAGEAQSVDNSEIIEFGCVIADGYCQVIDQRSFLVCPQLE